MIEAFIKLRDAKVTLLRWAQTCTGLIFEIRHVTIQGIGQSRKWGGGITGNLLYTPVITHKSEVYRFNIFKMNILAELVFDH